MNNIVIKENQIQNLIYEIREKEVMLNFEISVTKCRHYNGKAISMIINFADASAKLEKSQKYDKNNSKNI